MLDWLSKLPSNPAFPFVVGAVVGGLFAVVGGYLGSRVLVSDERRRQRHELIAAIQMTRAEMARNMTTITAKIGGIDMPPTAKLELYDVTFRTMAPVLARGLPMPLFGWLSEVNNQVSRLREVPSTPGRPKPEMDALDDLHERLRIANRLLLRYLRERFKVDVPRISSEDARTAQKIEASLERLLFPPPKWQFWKRWQIAEPTKRIEG